MGGANAPGEFQFDRVDVDRDHRVGSGERRAHDRRKAHPARPEDGERLPGGPVHGVQTAPTPVITAHAEMAAISGGTPSGIGSTLVSETTTRSAKHETPIR